MPLIEELHKLYQIDSQLRALRSRVDSAQRYLDIQTRELDALASRKAELEQRRKQFQANIANLESEAESIDQKLEKLRGDLNSAVNNKQYTTVLSELNTAKEQRSQVEDKTLSEMENIEKLDAELEELASKIAERSKVRDVASAQLQERQADVGERLAELERERAEAAEHIPSREMQTFESLADMYEGEAMAPVEEISRRNREYSCGVCNMQIPFEQVSALMNNADTVVCCVSCHRILYMADETKGALAGKK